MEEKPKDINSKVEKESDSIEDAKRWNPEWSEKAKSLTFSEATEIFEVFKNWYYPCGVLLHEVFFLHGVPWSFLPYPKDIIDSTLTIMSKYCAEIKDAKTFKNIQEVQSAIWLGFLPDEEVWKNLAKEVSSGRNNIPKEEIMRAKTKRVKRFNEEYIEWLKKVGKFNKL